MIASLHFMGLSGASQAIRDVKALCETRGVIATPTSDLPC